MPGRNPYFTGRKEQLEQIRVAFVAGGSVAVTQAIRGLGGIGKTSLAVEYAYVYEAEYTKRLFCRADSEASLASGFLALAGELGLSLPEEKPEYARQLVLGWLANHPGWLLIVDNVDFSGTLTPEALRTWLPPDPKGNVLLTSRTNEGFGKLRVKSPFVLDKMPVDDATAFLIGRVEDVTGEKVPPADQTHAFYLAQELDGLPLALEQAAAYIGNQGHSFERYLREFRKRFEHIEKAGPESEDYPYTIATTWVLNFQAVKKESPVAAEILRYSAFLSPDAIPGEIFIRGASELGDAIAEHFLFEGEPSEEWLKDRWEDALQPLMRYSLATLDRENFTHDVHRMVQGCVRNGFLKNEKEIHVTELLANLYQVFPDPTDIHLWILCQRLGGSVIEIGKYMFFNIENLKIYANIINLYAMYLQNIGLYTQSEPLYRYSLHIREENFPDNFQDIATSLNNLASVLEMLGKYTESVELYRRAIKIYEEKIGILNNGFANTLSNFALLMRLIGNYSEVESLYRRSIEIRELLLPESLPEIAGVLNNLSVFLFFTAKFEEAEMLMRRSLAIREKSLPENHPDIAESLGNLGEMLHQKGLFEESEYLFRRSLFINQKILPASHPNISAGLNNLASLLETIRRYDEAEPLYRQALLMSESSLPEGHPENAKSTGNLAGLLHKKGEHDESERLYRRALLISESSLSDNHPDIAIALNNLSVFLASNKRFDEAKPLFLRAIKIYVSIFGWEHPSTKNCIENYLMEKLTLQGKIHNSQDEWLKYMNEHPDEVQELLREVFASQSEMQES